MSSRATLRAFFTEKNIHIFLLYAFVSLFIATSVAHFWVEMQQIPAVQFGQDTEAQDEVKKLIDWQTQKQLRITVVILTIAIASIQFHRMTAKQINFPLLLLGIGLAIVQIIFFVRLFQNVQFIMNLEQQLLSPAKQYISDIVGWYQKLFFDKAGNFHEWGSRLFIVILAILIGFWIRTLQNAFCKWYSDLKAQGETPEKTAS